MRLYDDEHIHLQAPQEIVSLFSGSRQVVYGFMPHCKQVGGHYTNTYMYLISCSNIALNRPFSSITNYDVIGGSSFNKMTFLETQKSLNSTFYLI